MATVYCDKGIIHIEYMPHKITIRAHAATIRNLSKLTTKVGSNNFAFATSRLTRGAIQKWDLKFFTTHGIVQNWPLTIPLSLNFLRNLFGENVFWTTKK